VIWRRNAGVLTHVLDGLTSSTAASKAWRAPSGLETAEELYFASQFTNQDHKTWRLCDAWSASTALRREHTIFESASLPAVHEWM